MPIEFPSYTEVIQRVRSDLRGKLPNVDPTIFGSVARAFADSMGSRVFDAYLLEEQLLLQFFVQTATGQYLAMHGEPFKVFLNPATSSAGSALMSGSLGATVPAGTTLKSGIIEYQTQSTVAIDTITASVQSITRSGSTVTAIANGHSFSSGSTVSITGADQDEYNGNFEVFVISGNAFSYTVEGSPSTPATGTVTASILGALAQVVSSDTGTSQNLDSGAVLSLSTPIAGVNSESFVSFSGITGGTNSEDEEDYRSRIIERIGNPVSNFNDSQITQRAKGIAGVTRTWVQPITPDVGSVTIYFVRDNDEDIFPDSSEITAVKNNILLDLPATSDPESVFVLSPIPVSQGFSFSSITPDTPTMRTSIANSLSAFFEDKAQLGVSITQDQYRSAIQETQDTDTGDFLQSFSLSFPTGEITVASGELATLGSVVYA